MEIQDTAPVAQDRSLRPAAFLDRDGVLNVDHGYTFRPEELEFTPTAVEGVRILNEAGYRVFVVTNQSGVARGYYTTDDVERFHAHMQRQLLAHGAHVDRYYYCPFHPDGTVQDFAIHHEDRKPSPGMLLRAMREWPTDQAASVMIGDKDTDLEVATNAGVVGILVEPDTCDLAAVVRQFLASRARSLDGGTAG